MTLHAPRRGSPPNTPPTSDLDDEEPADANTFGVAVGVANRVVVVRVVPVPAIITVTMLDVYICTYR